MTGKCIHSTNSDDWGLQWHCRSDKYFFIRDIYIYTGIYIYRFIYIYHIYNDGLAVIYIYIDRYTPPAAICSLYCCFWPTSSPQVHQHSPASGLQERRPSCCDDSTGRKRLPWKIWIGNPMESIYFLGMKLTTWINYFNFFEKLVRVMFGTISVHPVLRFFFTSKSASRTSCFDECPMEPTVFSARSLPKDKPEWFPLCVCSIGDVLSSQRPCWLRSSSVCHVFQKKKYRTWVCPKFSWGIPPD